MSEKNVRVVGYLTIQGERWRYGGKNQPITSAKIVAVHQGEPQSLRGDQVAIKVTIELPAAAFDPLHPEAVIVVPPELIQQPVEVEAVEP